MVAIAVPVMIGFGVWQLQRLQWKEAQLAALAQNSSAPIVDLGEGPIPEDAQFRHVALTLHCSGGSSAPRAGRNLKGVTGFSHIGRCKAGGRDILLDAGWSERPEPVEMPSGALRVKGVLVKSGTGGWLLVEKGGVPPLAASAPPGIDTISNNHLSYAIQWFAFAATLAVIYAVWLRRRLR